MSAFEDILRKRFILSTARIRFSPHSQPVKETAVDKIIEHILFVYVIEEGLSLEEIQQTFSSQSGGLSINPSDIKNSLHRLVSNHRILSTLKGNHEVYKLSDEAKEDNDISERQAEARFNAVAAKLFKNAKEGFSLYIDPFVKSLSIIFSQLGEESVRLIKGDIRGEELASIPSTLNEIKKEFPTIDHALFENGLLVFFRDSDPEYDAIKWNVAQNYYIAKALGLDPTGAVLSKELFEHAEFYLDTNIIIAALEPKHLVHRNFLAFTNACGQLGITLKVCQLSLNELERWLAYQEDLIQKVIDQIPGAMASKVRSLFYEIYHEKTTTLGEDVNIDELFTSFRDPMQDLEKLFDAQLVDDIWFDTAKTSKPVNTLVKTLQTNYFLKRGHSKGQQQALHDVVLLFWIQRVRRETHNDNVWLLTLDTSLPGTVPSDSHVTSLGITLDALLQWISPLAVIEAAEDGFTAVFAEMIKNRILPRDRFFVLEDFLIFHEMHMSCKELPVEDVNKCIRYIKVNAPALDPTDPADREKLFYEVEKFFAVPGRKYKQEILKLETHLNERDRTIQGLEIKFSEYERKHQKDSLKRSARLRISLTIMLFLILEALVVFFANQYGEGQNLFQKVLKSWPFVGLAFAVTILVGGFLIGKERLKVLGWPFTKLFKHESPT